MPVDDLSLPLGALDMGGTNGKEEETPTADEVFNKRDADVVLISSDNVSFRIHSYFLQAVSPVFCALLENRPTDLSTTGSHMVLLTDDDLERAVVLKLLLHMATSGSIDKLSDMPYEDVIDLIHLCDKYDCATPLKLIAFCIEHPAAAVNPYHRFFYACALDDTEAAYRLFTPAATTSWPSRTSTEDVSVQFSFSGSGGLDMTGMQAAWLDRLPRKHFLALLRAARLRLQTPQASWQDVADEFKKQVLLQEPKKALIAA